MVQSSRAQQNATDFDDSAKNLTKPGRQGKCKSNFQCNSDPQTVLPTTSSESQVIHE